MERLCRRCCLLRQVSGIILILTGVIKMVLTECAIFQLLAAFIAIIIGIILLKMR